MTTTTRMATARTPSDRTPTSRTPEAAADARALEREVARFAELLDARFRACFEQDGSDDRALPAPPDLDSDSSGYASLVEAFGVYTEFGGHRRQGHGGFLPTLETAAFVLGGSALETRFALARLLDAGRFFNARDILDIDYPEEGGTLLGARLAVSPETLERVTGGGAHGPRTASGFPARPITTPLTWDDLVLASEVLAEIEDLNVWIRRSRTILDDWGLSRTLAPGFRTLFHGPPGTGKTLTATPIGVSAGAIVNVVRYAAIKALRHERDGIRRVDLIEGIRRELAKSGRTLR